MRTEIATDLELSVADAINAERSAAGLPGVKVEAHLNASAQAHSDWMADTGNFSHTGEDDSSVADRIEDTGFPLEGNWRMSENIAYTSISGSLDRGETSRMHEGLMDSSGHRANILDPDAAYVGIGLSVGNLTIGGMTQKVVYLTQNFADTDGRTLVQEEADGETVLQPYENGVPVGTAEPTDPPGEDPDDEEEDSGSGGGGGCFVATAAYGDGLHPDVRALRRWRDERLVRHAPGRAFIRAYWIIGPRLARVVAAERASGRVARALLAPIARMVGRGR